MAGLGEGWGPVLAKVKLEKDDVKGPFTPEVPTDYGEMAELKRLGYRNAAEKLAERFHVDLDFLRQLNPEASSRPGIEIIVPQLGEPAKGRWCASSPTRAAAAPRLWRGRQARRRLSRDHRKQECLRPPAPTR